MLKLDTWFVREIGGNCCKALAGKELGWANGKFETFQKRAFFYVFFHFFAFFLEIREK